jgi:hypothetical protein
VPLRDWTSVRVRFLTLKERRHATDRPCSWQTRHGLLPRVLSRYIDQPTAERSTLPGWSLTLEVPEESPFPQDPAPREGRPSGRPSHTTLTRRYRPHLGLLDPLGTRPAGPRRLDGRAAPREPCCPRYPGAYARFGVPGTGFEPACPCGRRILSPLTLPVCLPGPAHHSYGHGPSERVTGRRWRRLRRIGGPCATPDTLERGD